LIGAINELKRDKKLKIENQRKIESLKEENDKEIDQAIRVKKNRLILSEFQRELKRIKEEYLHSESEESETRKLSNKSSNPPPKKIITSTIIKKRINFDKSLKKMNVLKERKNKTGIVLPKINTIFSKKNRKKK
jgi:vacuolar-type H+-ATPase subunit H